MTETSQSYNTSPSPEQVEELLRSDYTKEDQEGDRAETEKVEAVRNELEYRKSLMATVNAIVDGFCSGVFTLDYTLDLLSGALQQFDVHPDIVQSAGTSSTSETIQTVKSKPCVSDIGNSYLNIVIPEEWTDTPLLVTAYDDDWTIQKYQPQLEQDLSKPGWTEEKTQELYELQRLKNELAATLQQIYIYADQVENNSNALLEDAFDDSERRGVEILNRYLASQIKQWVRRHLKTNLEVASHDYSF